jgi:hypothetical protein
VAIAIARQLGCDIAAEGEDLFGPLTTPGGEITGRVPAAHIGRTNGRIFCAATQNDLLKFCVTGLGIGQDDCGDRRRK